LLLVRQKK